MKFAVAGWSLVAVWMPLARGDGVGSKGARRVAERCTREGMGVGIVLVFSNFCFPLFWCSLTFVFFLVAVVGDLVVAVLLIILSDAFRSNDNILKPHKYSMSMGGVR